MLIGFGPKLRVGVPQEFAWSVWGGGQRPPALSLLAATVWLTFIPSRELKKGGWEEPWLLSEGPWSLNGRHLPWRGRLPGASWPSRSLAGCPSGTFCAPSVSCISSILRRHLFFSISRDLLGSWRPIRVWPLDPPQRVGMGTVEDTVRSNPPVLASGLLDQQLSGSCRQIYFSFGVTSADSCWATSLSPSHPLWDPLRGVIAAE